MIRALRPVGEPVPIVWRRRPPHASAPRLMDGFTASFFSSGTAALAAALKTALRRDVSGTKRVLLPAYGCPDLVSATLHAGGVPVLIDTRTGAPFLEREALERALAGGAAAIVAAHFLGLAERLNDLRVLCRRYEIPLIEDSAQRALYPTAPADRGDFIVLSFGRGKPPSSIGGGCLLVSDEWLTDEFSGTYVPQKMSTTEWHLTQLRSLLLCWAIHPLAYAIVRRLPGTGIGDTRFRRLEQIAPMNEAQHAAALQTLIRGTRTTLAQRRLGEIVSDYLIEIRDLTITEGHDPTRPLLRYPVTLSSEQTRNAVHKFLDERGLGVSFMYGRALCEMRDVPGLAGQQTPAAQDFARRLLTFPVHSAVAPGDLDAIAKGLHRVLNDTQLRALKSVPVREG